MPDTLQTFDSDGDDIPLMLARSWADATFEMLELSRKRRSDYRSISRTYDRMDGDAVDLAMLHRAIREVWSTDCLLILSASNLEAWIRKLYRARRRKLPEPLKHLKQLRNAIEHLDDANIDEETWTATARLQQSKKSGIGALPNQELAIGISGDGLLFGILSHDDLEGLVRGLLSELSQELDDYAQDWWEFVNSGR
jgi:hypothetical protein